MMVIKTKPHKRKQNENNVKPHWFVILSICIWCYGEWMTVIVSNFFFKTWYSRQTTKFFLFWISCINVSNQKSLSITNDLKQE